MNKEIFYSFKEYQENYTLLFDKYFLEYEEAEEIDFINSEIENYNICLQIVNLPIDKVFNKWFRIETGTNLKTFSIPQELYSFIFENEKYYCKLYSDITASTDKVEKKAKQARLGFAKIISFLESKKPRLGTNYQTFMKKEATLKWQGSQLEFAELTKALIQSNLISPELSEKERFDRMKQFFNVDDFSQSDKLKDIRKRSRDLTPLINTLQTALNNWIKSKD